MSMNVSIRRPSPERVVKFLAGQARLDFTYPEVGATRHGTIPPGYEGDRFRAPLGSGDEAFGRATRALRTWAQFDTGWTAIHPPGASLEPGNVIAILAHTCGVWTMHACRTIELVSEPPAAPSPAGALPADSTPNAVRRFGFLYGTLPGHGEVGEELFLVEQLADGSVWYEVRAFFRPADWRLRLLWPLLQPVMNRFRRESAAAMRRAVTMPG